MALLFAKTHEWLNDLGDGVAAIGISDFAINSSEKYKYTFRTERVLLLYLAADYVTLWPDRT